MGQRQFVTAGGPNQTTSRPVPCPMFLIRFACDDPRAAVSEVDEAAAGRHSARARYQRRCETIRVDDGRAIGRTDVLYPRAPGRWSDHQVGRRHAHGGVVNDQQSRRWF